MNFELVSKFKPTGDQPQAIKQIVEGLRQDIPYQTLQGAVSYTHLTLPTTEAV